MTDPDPVAVLAAQLAELRGEIRVLREGLEEDTGHTINLLAEVKRLREELADAVEKRKLKPPPAPWWRVGKDEGQKMLAELGEWVDTFLRPHFADYVARIPPCWASHMAVVWDLSTLRSEWIRVYGDEDNRDLQGALAWLNRYLPDTVDRIAEALKQCDETRCRLATRYT